MEAEKCIMESTFLQCHVTARVTQSNPCVRILSGWEKRTPLNHPVNPVPGGGSDAAAHLSAANWSSCHESQDAIDMKHEAP